MKNFIRVMIFISVCCVSANAVCYYVPCNQNYSIMKKATKLTYTPLYKVESALLTELNNLYKKQIQALKEQNKALDTRISTLESNVIKLKEVTFHMQKFNKILSNYIKIRAIAAEE